MNRYLVIPPTGDMKVIDASTYDSSYEALRQNIGGYIECVSLGPNLDMWVHDEGKLEGQPSNPRAQLLFELEHGTGVDVIVGTVVITAGADDEGETLPLDEATTIGLMAVL